MHTRQLINKAVRYALMTSAALATVSYTATASAANADTPAQLGKVTVTGTRIKRTDVETAQPITRINRQQIERSGYTNVGDLLGQLSSAGAHTNSATLYTDGSSQVNLRNLGSNRTLVLVNGKRWIQGLGGTTNVSTIPVSIIDHIEILQDGASAVYGSDAIAGVVNIITVKNFKGAAAHAYYGIRNDHKTGRWDGQTKQYDFTVGGGNDRGNVVFNATYREQNETMNGSRKLLQSSVAGQPPYVNGTAGTPRGRFSFFGPGISGQTFGQSTCGMYDSGAPTNILCDLTLQNAPAQPATQNFRTFQDTDRYPEVPGLSLQAGTKHVSLYVQGHYDLFDNVTFTANAAYTREDVVRHQPPDPLRVGGLSSKTADGQLIGIAASNPYNPFGENLVASTSDPCLAAGTCIGLGTITRRMTEAGPRVATTNRDNFHIFAGFNGFVNVFNREVDWDVGFAQNRVQSTDITNGDFNLARVAQALGPASQCTSPCVPLNFFGGAVKGNGGSITQDQVNYIGYEAHDISQGNLRDWSANLSSDVYDLPAGPLGVAVGYERIDNYGYSHPDAIRVQGNDSDYNPGSQDGRVVRNAEYAELNIPLLADLPGVNRLSVDIANRWTQFERSGGVTGQANSQSFAHNSAGRLNIRWQVINDLLLRASWSQGFRTPNVNELFSGQFEDFIPLTDPCAGGQYGGYQGGALPSNCPNGRQTSQPNSLVHTTSGSNKNLQPESSLSRTFGFVYSPSQVPGLDVNADYFKIEITNAVGSVGAQNILNGCFNNGAFCNLIQLRGSQITNILNVNTNVGSELTEGVDVGVHYKFPATPVGDFDARIDGTFLRAFDVTNTNLATTSGFATSHLAGVDPRPKRRFNGYLNWDYGNWGAQYHIEYIGSEVDQCGVAIQGYCSEPNANYDYQGTPNVFTLGRNHLGATVYHDVHVDYTVPKINTTFSVGVNNLFDKKPPITGRGGLGSFNFGFYRLPSRLVYGSVRVRF